jgi:hypothetical protein
MDRLIGDEWFDLDLLSEIGFAHGGDKVATICGARDMRLKRDVLVTEWGGHL